MITTETRVHQMAARDDLDRPDDGHANVDIAHAAALIDRALKSLCPHLPLTWKSTLDSRGRTVTTCYSCGMNWHEPEDDRRSLPYTAARERAAYMVLLEDRLRARTLEHGYPYVTPTEGERLHANGIRQSGHSVHRFSTAQEDRSDLARNTQAGEVAFENEGGAMATRRLTSRDHDDSVDASLLEVTRHEH